MRCVAGFGMKNQRRLREQAHTTSSSSSEIHRKRWRSVCEGAFSVTAVFLPRLRFCRATSDNWVLWRRAADKVAVEAAAGPEKMKSQAERGAIILI